MKTIRNYLVIILMLLMAWAAKAQDKRFTASIFSDPVAIYKDGFNVGAAIEYQMTVTYFKAQVFAFPDLRGVSYYHLQGTVLGLNHHTYRDEFRLYGGGKLGLIQRRDGNSYTYPTFGFEAGIEWYPSKDENGFYIGIEVSADWRQDFMYWGTDPVFRGNGAGKIGFSF